MADRGGTPAAARKALLVVSGAALLALAWTGLSGGIRQIPESRGTGEIVQSLSQIVYGLSAALAVVTTGVARRWRPWMLTGFAVGATLAGGLAPVVWGDSSIGTGVIGGLSALLIALALAWGLQVGSRGIQAEEANRR